MVIPDVEELQTMFHGIFPDEESDVVRRSVLKVAVPDVQDLVEKTSDMETETDTVFRRNFLRVFAGFYPAAV